MYINALYLRNRSTVSPLSVWLVLDIFISTAGGTWVIVRMLLLVLLLFLPQFWLGLYLHLSPVSSRCFCVLRFALRVQLDLILKHGFVHHCSFWTFLQLYLQLVEGGLLSFGICIRDFGGSSFLIRGLGLRLGGLGCVRPWRRCRALCVWTVLCTWFQTRKKKKEKKYTSQIRAISWNRLGLMFSDSVFESVNPFSVQQVRVRSRESYSIHSFPLMFRNSTIDSINPFRIHSSCVQWFSVRVSHGNDSAHSVNPVWAHLIWAVDFQHFSARKRSVLGLM